MYRCVQVTASARRGCQSTRFPQSWSNWWLPTWVPGTKQSWLLSHLSPASLWHNLHRKKALSWWARVLLGVPRSTQWQENCHFQETDGTFRISSTARDLKINSMCSDYTGLDVKFLRTNFTNSCLRISSVSPWFRYRGIQPCINQTLVHLRAMEKARLYSATSLQAGTQCS